MAGAALCMALSAGMAIAGSGRDQQTRPTTSDSDTRTSIRQIDDGISATKVAVDSETREPVVTDVDQLGSTQPAAPVAQIVPSAAAPVLPLVQVGARDRAMATGPQISTSGRSAQGPSPLSNPGQSAPQAVVRLTGDDSCDPASATAQSAACARVIETRSAEYRSASAPVLSPEQRLLIDQQQREMAGDPAAIARRLGRSDVDADAQDAQGIASLVFPGNPAEVPVADPENALDGLNQDTINLIQSIVQNAQGAVPQ